MDVHDKKLFICNKLTDVFYNANGSPGYTAGLELHDELKSSGYIAGLEKDDKIFCLAAALSTNYFLTGLDVLGIYCLIDDDNQTENELISKCHEYIRFLNVELENPVILLVYKDNKSVKLSGKIFSVYYSSLSEIETTLTSENPTVLFRASGKIPLLFETSADTETMKENVELAFEKLRSTVESQVAAFLLQDSNFIFTRAFSENDSSVNYQSLLKFINDSDLVDAIKKSIKSSRKKMPLKFDILIQTSGDAALENNVNHSLVIHCQRRDYQCVTLSLPIDVLIVGVESTCVSNIYKQFIKAILRQLKMMSECLLTYATNFEYVCPVPYHFYPDCWNVPLTEIYPSNKTDTELEERRRILHTILLLPLDRPLLRKSNSYEFSNATSAYLINPHEGLSPSGVVDGKPAIVFGRYAYHHYMQDRMNDNGWGCAYRSLQTIISWFRFQGYTNINIPTHAEIQQALVDIGDKPQNFVGSKKWIGSQEVSFCLNHFIQVESKIMCVSSGSEMANKGRELFLHFRDQGTPVMIGGGVLAHTILGVDFNENSGDLKFLILDPHYTGGEDIHTVQSKGWCGWKGVNFWDQNAFYNLCLPQRPLQV